MVHRLSSKTRKFLNGQQFLQEDLNSLTDLMRSGRIVYYIQEKRGFTTSRNDGNDCRAPGIAGERSMEETKEIQFSTLGFRRLHRCIAYQTKPRIFVILLVCLCLVQYFALPIHAKTSPDQVERFKAFVSSPPPISECRFREILAHGKPYSTTNFYFVRWQTNAILVHRFLDEAHFLRARARDRSYGGDVAARYDSNYWHVGRSAAVEWNPGTKDENSESPGQVISSVRDLAFSRILSGGPQRIEIGSIRWEGDSYTATDSAGLEIRAELLTDGRTIRGLDVNYFYIGREVSHRYRYPSFSQEYPFLPSVIHRLDENDQIAYSLEIVDFRISERPLNRRSFKPELYYHTGLLHQITIDVSGHKTQADFEYLRQKKGYFRSIFILICLLVPAGAFALHLLRQTQLNSAKTRT
jgi:hypothetical protein